MEELLLYITENLLDSPEEISIKTREEGDRIVLELRVAPDDIGRIIGRHGKVVRSIRSIMRSAAQKQGKYVSVEILDAKKE